MNPQLFSTNAHGQTPFDVALEVGASEELLDVLKNAWSHQIKTTAAKKGSISTQVSAMRCMCELLPACLPGRVTGHAASDSHPWVIDFGCEDARTADQKPHSEEVALQRCS